MSYEKLPLVAAMSRKDVEGIAEGFLRKYHPETLTNPKAVPIVEIIEFDMAEAYGAIFSSAHLAAPAEGVTIPGDPLQIILSEPVYDSLVQNNGRARFTAAHEVGHGILHAHQLKQALVSQRYRGLYRKVDIPAYANPEWQANVFASCLLMPRPSLELALTLFGPNVEKLVGIYQVSYQAMRIRLGDFGVR